MISVVENLDFLHECVNQYPVYRLMGLKTQRGSTFKYANLKILGFFYNNYLSIHKIVKLIF